MSECPPLPDVSNYLHIETVVSDMENILRRRVNSYLQAFTKYVAEAALKTIIKYKKGSDITKNKYNTAFY